MRLDHPFIQRIRVLLGSLVTWLVLLAVILTAAAPTITEELGIDHPAVVWLVKIITVIGVIVTIIRNVTRVLPEARGVITPAEDTPYTAREEALMFELDRAHQDLERARSGIP